MTRPVRILFVLNDSGGGATQGILEMLRGLPRDQYEAYLVSPQTPNPRQQANFADLATGWQVVPYTWWNRQTAYPLAYRPVVWLQGMVRTRARLRPWRRILALIHEWQIDLVYTTTSLTIEGALAARWAGMPHIWHIKETIGSAGRVKFGLPDAWLTRFYNATATQVLVMTHYIGQIFVRQNQAQKISVVYDGVEVERFRDHRRGLALRQQLGISPDELLIGMVAALSATWKQHRYFMEMATLLADRYPQACFAAFGTPPVRKRNPAYRRPWDYFQQLQQQVHQAGLGKRFLWPGFVGDIPQLMDALDVLVHPCAIEPFGRVAIEAMAAGRPVVGPKQGGIAESVVDGVTGLLVEPDNGAALAAAVARLIDDPRLRRRMGDSGRDHVARHFSLERHVRQMQHIFETTIDRQDPARAAVRPVETIHAP